MTKHACTPWPQSPSLHEHVVVARLDLCDQSAERLRLFHCRRIAAAIDRTHGTHLPFSGGKANAGDACFRRRSRRAVASIAAAATTAAAFASVSPCPFPPRQGRRETAVKTGNEGGEWRKQPDFRRL